MFKLYLIIHFSTAQAEEKAKIFTTEVIIHIHRARISAYHFLEKKKKERKKRQMRLLYVRVSGFLFLFLSIWLLQISQQTQMDLN